VFYLILLLLLTFLVLTALLWGGTRLIQTALYEGVEGDLYWRAPAAAGALTAYVGLWALLNYAATEPGQTELPYDNLFNFTTEKVSERPVSEFWALRGDVQIGKYTKRDLPGSPPRHEYRGEDGQLWQAARTRDVDTIVIREGKEKNPVKFKAVPGQGRYVEEGGRRYLEEEGFGRITTPRGGGSWFRVLLNVLHFVVWFVVLWLLLRFQWAHALGLAAALWLVMTFVVPYIFHAAADAKAAKAAPAQTSQVPPASRSISSTYISG
jgi:hypothetical protein